MGPGNVDHHRCVYFAAVVESDPRHAAAALEDLDDPPPEAEAGAVGLGGHLQIVGGQLRVGDVTRARPEHSALNGRRAGFAEVFLIDAFRRPVPLQVEDGQAFANT